MSRNVLVLLSAEENEITALLDRAVELVDSRGTLTVVGVAETPWWEDCLAAASSAAGVLMHVSEDAELHAAECLRQAIERIPPSMTVTTMIVRARSPQFDRLIAAGMYDAVVARPTLARRLIGGRRLRPSPRRLMAGSARTRDRQPTVTVVPALPR
jgi:hypothetical protein